MKPMIAELARDWEREIKFHNALVEDGNKAWFKSVPVNAVPFFEIIRGGEVLDSFSAGPGKLKRIQERLAAQGIRPKRPVRRRVARLWNRIRSYLA